jgi:hypothetical protein
MVKKSMFVFHVVFFVINVCNQGKTLCLSCIFRICCVFSLSYPACKAHAHYYIVISGLPGSTTFVHIISKKGTILREKVTEHKMCVIICLMFAIPKCLTHIKIYNDVSVKHNKTFFGGDLWDWRIIRQF